MHFTAVLVDGAGVGIQHSPSAVPVLAAVQGPKFVAPVTKDLQNGSFSISFVLVATGAYTVRTKLLTGGSIWSCNLARLVSSHLGMEHQAPQCCLPCAAARLIAHELAAAKQDRDISAEASSRMPSRGTTTTRKNPKQNNQEHHNNFLHSSHSHSDPGTVPHSTFSNCLLPQKDA